MLELMASLLIGAQSLLAAPAVSVTADSRSLPPRAAAWVGDAPHRFLGGQVTLFCGSHGVFTDSVMPTAKQGATTTLSYGAVFTGELVLRPPQVSAPTTYAIKDPIRIRERVMARGREGAAEEFVTELESIDFEGDHFPAGLQVRESQQQRSVGSLTVQRQRGGGFRISAHYDVWLELSLDGGRSWHPADNAVRMWLRPDSARTTLSVSPESD